MFNMRNLTLVAFLFILTLALSPAPAVAGCGTCGPAHSHADGHDHAKEAPAKAACAADCSKPCCAKSKKKACGPDCSKACCAKSDHGYGKIDTDGVKKLIEAKEKVIFLDARSGESDDGRRIPGALALAPGASADAVAKTIPAKDTKVVVYCSNLNCGASAKLGEELAKMGYSNVHKYPDGIDGWEKAGGTVEKADK